MRGKSTAILRLVFDNLATFLLHSFHLTLLSTTMNNVSLSHSFPYQGSWLRAPYPTRQAFDCCGWDQTPSHPGCGLCHLEQVATTLGNWFNSTSPAFHIHQTLPDFSPFCEVLLREWVKVLWQANSLCLLKFRKVPSCSDDWWPTNFQLNLSTSKGQMKSGHEFHLHLHCDFE